MEWHLRALDTLFFRGPSPFTAGESVFLPSEFPPSPQTLQGMVRTALLEGHNIDLLAYGRPDFVAPPCPLCPDTPTCQIPEIVGPAGDQLGTLSLHGPYLIRGGTRLYPAPADLWWNPTTTKVGRLAPGTPVRGDKGLVRLPSLRPHDAHHPDWITEAGLLAYLEGGTPTGDQLVQTAELATAEPRVGLTLDTGPRAAQQGMLYSIAPLRLRDEVRLGVRLSLASEEALASGLGMRRLGGEGRMVEVLRGDGPAAFPLPPMLESTLRSTGRFRLVLLQPADFGGSWLPPGFVCAPETEEAVTSWAGSLAGVLLRIIVSCGGSPTAIGGWDMAKQAPKALRWCVPAGTVYYGELDNPDDAPQLLQGLHDQKTGANGKMGFGHILVGAWTDLEGDQI